MALELVLDASVLLAWVIKERDVSRAAYAQAIARLAAGDTVRHVPLRCSLETGHVLRREFHTEHYSAREVFGPAGRYHLQGYDATYFELARVLKLPLATLDHGHIQAVRQRHGGVRYDPDIDEPTK